MSHATADDPKIIPELDGLRGIAILTVMTFHFTLFPTLLRIFEPVHSGWLFWVQSLLASCWSGVDLFFVLSGFLITGILLDAKGGARYFRTFFARRALRIFPAYYVLLLAWLFVARQLPPELGQANNPSYGGWVATYLGNVLLVREGWAALPVGLHHLWSLAVEEQFYLCWPLLIYVVPVKRTTLVIGSLFAVALLSRYLMYERYPQAPYVFTLCRLDALAAGAYLAVKWRTSTDRATFLRRAQLVGVVALALLVAMFLFRGGLSHLDPLVQVAGFSLLAVFYAVVVASCVWAQKPIVVLRTPVLRWFGKYSYGLYLVHNPICLLLLPACVATCNAIDAPLWLAIIVFIALPLVASAVAAFLLWHLCEKHFLKLKKRWEQPRVDPRGRAA